MPKARKLSRGSLNFKFRICRQFSKSKVTNICSVQHSNFHFFSIQTSAKNDAARNALNYLKIMTKKPPAAAAAKDVDIEAKSKDHPTRSHNGASKKLI
jgi:hypothetical protein